MKKAVQFGAGNIGRGFIGAVLSSAGYKVVFADVVADLLDRINSRKEYTVHIRDNQNSDITISNISAVNSGSSEAINEIADADIVTTAVGLGILRFVAPAIAKGLILRRKSGIEKPLNIIACENGLRATSRLKELVIGQLDPETEAWINGNVGFPDAAVDRIVPPVHCEIPLDVAVEEYFEWDVEKSAFAGDIPEIKGMTPVDNLEAYIERKLFTLNTGHSTAAYIGKMKGYKTINESIGDKQIYEIVKGAMQQSGEGLVKKFNFDHERHFAYIERILRRFCNPYLKDDVDRVGREPLRKLAGNDRLILPMVTAKGFGLPYDNLLLSIGAALHFNNPDDKQSVEMLETISELGLAAAVSKFTGIASKDSLIAEIVDAYGRIETLTK
ncbi:MAG: mannitol-1-phosphate 5-dehydrogenase [Bacteroidales bacterium]|jgi:mannitol-1-phosphate 5-dehydrogenase|nr:mannitol-1-phosphate 5-dehydrogenase [Bacteroidales bacterium]MCI1784808.1 mannitol-1-phosphate 5-dehydrogenase [Bacteroidales bacterium]